jgi:hypothetical protein
LHIQVPSKVIRNDGCTINNGDFLLYVRLCFLYFRNYKNEEIKIDHRKLMNNIGIADTRTLKKRLDKLFKENLIKNQIKTFPKRGEVVILFNGQVVKENEHFTMMNIKIFDTLDKIDEHSFRLVFYYKSHINLNDGRGLNYCYVGRETLKHNLKMGTDTIKAANEMLVKNKLIKIIKHKLEHDDTYDDNNELIFEKYNNHYIVHNDLF